MKMTLCSRPFKCSFCGCRNLAKYSFSTKGFLRKDLVFCEDCMKGMYECFSKTMVPKSVEAPFKKKKTKKEDSEVV